LKTIYFP